jgi:streptomycin 6-kinase
MASREMSFPEAFIKSVTTTWGQEGTQWLKQLPKQIPLLSKKWDLSDIVLMKDLTYNCIVRATHPLYGSVALKIAIGHDSWFNERAALTAYQGNGSVRLYESDEEFNALLIEGLVPGRSARELFPHDDEKATHYAAEIMKKLKEVQASEETFRDLSEWFLPLTKRTHREIPPELYDRARRWVADLCSLEKTGLAHGDLHHSNILESHRGWVSIDPKGVTAPFGFDCGAFMCNPLPEFLTDRHRKSITGRRLDQFADELALDRRLLVQMSYCQALLAACWSLDDNDPSWSSFVTCASLIADH